VQLLVTVITERPEDQVNTLSAYIVICRKTQEEKSILWEETGSVSVRKKKFTRTCV